MSNSTLLPDFDSEFDAQLLARLKDEHRLLEKLFADLARAAQARDGRAFQRVVRTCEFTLKVHHKLEDERMYGYLLQSVSHSARMRQTLEQTWRAMNSIARNVFEGMDDYLRQDPSAIDFARASLDVGDLATMLGERIDREESELYPLYQEPAH